MNAAQVIAALQAGAWVPLTLDGGFTARSGNYVPAARQRGDTIELCGGISGTIGTGGIAVATVPTLFVPASTVDCAGASSGGNSVVVGIAVSTGVMTITVAASSSFVVLDGISYRLI